MSLSGTVEVLLDGLNAAQQEAVVTSKGPVLIIAGPGSGKTRTLTFRIAHLLNSGLARPEEILALTFTNKAAREMKERILSLVGEDSTRGIWMGTFHSIFARILRRESPSLGYDRDFSIYDQEDSRSVIRRLMRQYDIDSNRFSPHSLQSLISGAKNQLISPDEYGRMAAGPAQEKAAQLYGPYQEILRNSNAMDFDDLLVKPIILFENQPELLARYQRRWKFMHIDEYQDTNRAQYTISKMLAAGHRNVCVVGDDAQSIYAFRGADIRNILEFQRDYPEAKVLRLEQNYRSTGKILRLADGIIKRNKDQLKKSLWTDNREGEFVLLMEAISEKDEAQKIERTIRDLHLRDGYAPRSFAVLYRTNAQSRSIEDALRRGGIPYRVVGGVSFYQRKEIKDVLAYLRLLVNPNDSANLRRVINYPARGIGDKTIARMEEFAAGEGVSLWQAIERVEACGLPGRAQNAVEKFRFLIARFAAQAESRPADELARELIQETGILIELRQENTIESLARWENVQELINAIAEFTANAPEGAGLSDFLQEVSLVSDLDSLDAEDNQVTLMTLHASKGLEFPVVFITGLEEGLFPLAIAAQDRLELEEERRLLYVGVTRAEERLFLTCARSRYRYGQHQASVRSRFLDEIDPDVVRTEAGGGIRQQSDRFSLNPEGPTAKADPYYYRKNLRTDAQPRPEAGSGRRILYDEGEGGAILPGVKVFHETFGQGKVIAMEGRGEMSRVTVFFKEVGQKKLVLKFARLRRLE